MMFVKLNGRYDLIIIHFQLSPQFGHGDQIGRQTSYCLVGKKRVDNPGGNPEVQTSLQNNVPEENVKSQEGNDANA